MKKQLIWLSLILATALFQPFQAYSKEPHHHKQSTHEIAPRESDLQEHGSYVNKKGKTVHSPAHSKSGAIPSGASAHCGDGTYSFSQSHRGTCSHHGGVAQWLN